MSKRCRGQELTDYLMDWVSVGGALQDVAREATRPWDHPELMAAALQARAIVFAGERIAQAIEKLAGAIAADVVKEAA
jgi:hypothetical protein